MIFPLMTNGGGMCFMFPDVCKTPTPAGPVPIPYPNIAQCATFKGGTLSKKVLILNKKASIVGSETSASNGDEAGTAGGVKSSKNMGPAYVKLGSFLIEIEGKQAGTHLISMVGMNGGANFNIPGLQVAPSQSVVKGM